MGLSLVGRLRYCYQKLTGKIDATKWPIHYNITYKKQGYSMSKVIAFSSSLGLKISNAKVGTINPVIFKTQIDKGQFGSVVRDGDTSYIIDVKNNTSTELTAKTVQGLATDGYKADVVTMAQASAISVSESCGVVTEISFEKDGKGTLRPSSLASFCKANGYKVKDVTVETQNNIIFKTAGLKSIEGLVKDGDSYYQIDVTNNTAEVVDAAGLSKKATDDLKAGKNTSATAFAESFGLISKLTLVKA
jgi:uncharacterized membrane protein YkoI